MSPAKPRTPKPLLVVRPTGILKEGPISPGLANFRGASEASRTGAVRKFWSYIKTNNLQGINLPVLKKLYYLLIQLSLEAMKSFEADVNYLDMVCRQFGVTMELKELCSLSDVLYKELDDRFKQLLHALQDDSSSQICGQSAFHSNLSASTEELTLLLRCCMVILTLLGFDQNLLIDKGRVLLSVLSRLISTELTGQNEKNSICFKELCFSEFTHVNDVCTTPVAEGFSASIHLGGASDTLLTFRCALLQVFADEMLMHKSLREYFMLIDYTSSTNEMIFMCNFGHGDVGTVLEVMAAQFILSISNEKAFECFLNRLFWQHGKDFRVPDMSLTSSLSLLLNPIMLSAPKIFQAYLILLVSEAIGTDTCSEHLNPDLRIMDCYLTAFERSIVLYNSHMRSLNMDHPGSINGSTVKSCLLGSGQLSFDSYLQPATKNKINHLVAKFNDSWGSYLNNTSRRIKSDLVDASIAYVKDSLNVFDKSYRDEILSILTSIIHRGSSDNICDTIWCKEGRSPQDIYLLASILKLMSSSMLQAIWCLRRSSNSGCLKNLLDVLVRKEYDFMVHLLGCFQQFNIHLPIQKFVSDMMETHPTRHKESKWMLMHFSGLLSLSYVGGLDFLVKDCIFTMMSLLNLFVFEEGDLDALSLLFASQSSEKTGEALGEQKSSKMIASKFQMFQTTYLSKGSITSFNEINNDKRTESSEEDRKESACNGEIFLKCLLEAEGSKRSSDFDDLADFIECKQGKDYFVWLKDRRRFRKWKCEREAVYKRQKRYRRGK